MTIKYPRIADHYAVLEDGEEAAEMDCGCILREGDPAFAVADTIVYYQCTLHNFAQQLLDALDQVADRAYRRMGPDGIHCRFCALEITGIESQLQHRPPCPMNVVHQVIRRAKGGEISETNTGMPPADTPEGP